MTTPEEIQPAESKPARSPEEQEKVELNKRLETAAWGLFLVMLGCLWLVPEDRVPEDTWLLGAGIILVGLNLVRFLKGIQMSNFTLFLGAVGILLGVSGLLGVEMPVFPIIIILIGLSILFGQLVKKS